MAIATTSRGRLIAFSGHPHDEMQADMMCKYLLKARIPCIVGQNEFDCNEIIHQLLEGVTVLAVNYQGCPLLADMTVHIGTPCKSTPQTLQFDTPEHPTVLHERIVDDLCNLLSVDDPCLHFEDD